MNYLSSYLDWEGEVIPFESIDAEAKWFQLVRYAEDFNVAVETGTALGHTTEVLAENFSRVWTIELSPAYFEGASHRLEGIDNITMLLGSSSTLLKGIIEELDQPALFYLDGHYSGPGTGQDFDIDTPDTPVLLELEALADSFYSNVIIIDDARIFKGEEWHDERFAQYPSRKELENIVDSFRVPSYLYRELDAFIIEPKEGQ